MTLDGVSPGESARDGESREADAHALPDSAWIPDSESKYEALFAWCPDAIVVQNAEGGVLEANPAAWDLFEYEPGRWPGLTSADLVADRERPRLDAWNAGVPPDGHFFSEMRLKRSDGTEFDAEVRSWITRINGEALTFVFIHDISRRRAAERARSEEARFLQSLLAANPTPIFYKDADGRYMGCNEAFEKLTGTPREKIMGRTVHEVWPQAFSDTYRDKDLELIDSPGTQVYEGQLVDAAGSTRDVVFYKSTFTHADDRVAGIIGTILDITDRKKAEEALRLSEERFRQIFEASSDCITVWDKDYNYLFVNQAAIDHVGTTRDKVEGKTIREGLGHMPGFMKMWMGRVNRVVKSGEGMRVEDAMPIGDRMIYSESVLSPLRNAQGDVFAVAVVYRDVSARREAEAERERMAQALRQSEKMRSLSVMAGAVAHHFNNLLMTVLGNVEMVADEVPADSMARRMADEAHMAAKRASELSSQMLVYVGQGRQDPEYVDLTELLEESMRMFASSGPEEVRLHHRFGADTKGVNGDPTQLRRVAISLLENAVESLEGRGGSVTLSSGTEECDRQTFRETYLNENLPEGLYTWFQVSDDGPGMDEATVSRIFDPFFTTKFTGRGLGLATVIGIVRAHGGAVRVISRLGAGTIVRVFLPAAESPPPKRIETVPSDIRQWRGSGTVLLVEDEMPVARLCRLMLERTGFEVEHARDGIEAVEMFQSMADDIVCVMLDLVMPRMTGEEAFGEIRRIRPDVPIVISSGFNPEEVARRFYGRELDGILHKPYRREGLAKVLHRALKMRRGGQDASD